MNITADFSVEERAKGILSKYDREKIGFKLGTDVEGKIMISPVQEIFIQEEEKARRGVIGGLMPCGHGSSLIKAAEEFDDFCKNAAGDKGCLVLKQVFDDVRIYKVYRLGGNSNGMEKIGVIVATDHNQIIEFKP